MTCVTKPGHDREKNRVFGGRWTETRSYPARTGSRCRRMRPEVAMTGDMAGLRNKPPSDIQDNDQLREEYRKLRSREARYLKHTHDLIERVKELHCLYTISELTNRAESLESIFAGTAGVIPSAMQYPDIACARIEWESREYRSEPFFASNLSCSAKIIGEGAASGWVEVFYRETAAIPRRGAFLREEKKLIDEIAFQLGNVIARFVADQRLHDARRELEQKARSLEEMNTALKVLLEHQKRERAEVEKNILSNLNILVLPYIEKMRAALSGEGEQAYLDIIERNLAEITGTFSKSFSNVTPGLTPTEIQIARMVVKDFDTKRIADLLHVSESAVNFHRKNIRRKLGIANRKVNLNSYLRMLFAKG